MKGYGLGSTQRIRAVFGIGVLTLLLTVPAGAETIYDATSPFAIAAHSVGKSATGTINQIADAFTMLGSGLELESITVKISRQRGDGDFAIRFWSDEAGFPGTVLESWAVPGALEQSTEVTVDSIEAIPLSEGELYWVSIAMPDDISGGSWIAIDAAPDGEAVSFSNGETPTWYDASGLRQGALFLRVTAVPEPSAAGLSRVSLACVAFLARSRRARRLLRRAA